MALGTRIGELWNSERDAKNTARRNRVELHQLRDSLAENLHGYKALLARAGRNGQWKPFLREKNIPRTTADRLVRTWAARLQPALVNGTTGAVSCQTDADIQKLVGKLKPGLVRKLTTQEAITSFLALLTKALAPAP